MLPNANVICPSDACQSPRRAGNADPVVRALASPARRRLLRQLAGSTAFAVVGFPAFAQDAAAPVEQPAEAAAPEQPQPQAFTFDTLTEEMRQLATQEPRQPEALSGFLSQLDYDGYQRIQFNPERARWRDGESLFQVNAFSMGWLFKETVGLFEVVDGMKLPMTFSTADFLYHEPLNTQIPKDLAMPGVAGFRLNAQLNRADTFDELVAFLGASYFRALGRGNRYGLSSRGLAVNTGLSSGEEFPRFSAFYLERPAPGSDEAVIYASLESASLTGAYRFAIRPGENTEIDVTTRLFLRNDVEQIGIAPLTSMYLFGSADKGEFDDYRPAVHDSQALVLDTQGGDRFYRPLKNPPRLASSYLGAMTPKAFGLVQRSRDFDDYLDAGARYDLRPSLMIEPIGDWGKGFVRLVEIPSDLEGNDNIVAFWVPDASFTKGASFEVSYRMIWGMTPGSDETELAQVLRTRAGHGGVAGVKPAKDRRKFVIDFAGGLLGELPADAEVSPTVQVSNGEIVETVLSYIDGTQTWRLVTEVSAPDGSIVEIKASVSGYGRQLTETWLYQWVKE
ncbi:glucan biosynthesis protein [Pseudooceanicola spongiae]|uniref:Glucan biosynthesis protein D n=1 Tax=Pseudooceanicola spongiae TaxID=2613965 RepID=A0A7L9WQC3_9RHOB|nr:glucan biosynthesis protein G [Pseudooceanicola spongiae]QOL81270.1 glucan biosynthesis protein D [Pseudooceanicola spongiae]